MTPDTQCNTSTKKDGHALGHYLRFSNLLKGILNYNIENMLILNHEFQHSKILDWIIIFIEFISISYKNGKITYVTVTTL